MSTVTLIRSSLIILLSLPDSAVRGVVRFDVDKRAPGCERRQAHGASSSTGEDGWNTDSQTTDSSTRETGEANVDSDQGEPGILREWQVLLLRLGYMDFCLRRN